VDCKFAIQQIENLRYIGLGTMVAKIDALRLNSCFALPIHELTLFAGFVGWKRKLGSAMKRQTRKSGKKKLPMLWDEAMDFEVAIRPLSRAEIDLELENKIIMLPLPELIVKFPHNPQPPMAA
jgi:hypothetical protein